MLMVVKRERSLRIVKGVAWKEGAYGVYGLTRW